MAWAMPGRLELVMNASMHAGIQACLIISKCILPNGRHNWGPNYEEVGHQKKVHQEKHHCKSIRGWPPEEGAPRKTSHMNLHLW